MNREGTSLDDALQADLDTYAEGIQVGTITWRGKSCRCRILEGKCTSVQTSHICASAVSSSCCGQCRHSRRHLKKTEMREWKGQIKRTRKTRLSWSTWDSRHKRKRQGHTCIRPRSCKSQPRKSNSSKNKASDILAGV